MIYVVELQIDDGKTKLLFFETTQEAHPFFDRAAGPLTDGVPIKNGGGAFVEEARMFEVETDNRAEAKAQVEAGAAKLVRDSAAEKAAFFDDLDLSFP